MIRPLAALSALALLSGCISFGAKPPKSLLTLKSEATVAADAVRRAGAGQAITILTPSTPATLAAPRIPVYQRGVAIAYVKDALWVDAPSRLFQQLLSETVGAKTNHIVLDQRQYSADPGIRLNGQLQSFGIDADTNEAVVVYDAFIARGDALETRRFEARQPVALIDPANAATALNVAANAIAVQVAGWIG